jgi:23S rRNA (pseudouridine1915-N3)-methyltransferase
MQTLLLLVGKTTDARIDSLMHEYIKKINRYQPFEIDILPELKKKGKITPQVQKEKEGKYIIEKFKKGDLIVLLDENGKTHSSVNFSRYINQKRLGSQRRLVFVVGGPYGFSAEVYEHAQEKISLSCMTFSHQMVRLFFLEQLYRVNTILNNEPYHHP